MISRNRLLQRAGQAIRGLGLQPGRIETPRSKWAGISLRWKPDPPEVTRGAVVEAVIHDVPVRFFVNDDSDMIQGYHLRGTFFEEDEILVFAPFFKGGLFVDIGANIGNHALYALKFLGADRVIAFEPNPVALRVLELNMILNGHERQVAIHRVGLSDREGRVALRLPFANIGGAWLEDSDAGELTIVPGDPILADEPVGFLKIDTEGHELRVLAGLRETIARHRPPMFVEVEDGNIPAFEALMAETGYRTEATFKRYAVNTNFLVVPADPPRAQEAG